MLSFFVRNRLLLAAFLVSTVVAAVSAKLNTSGNLLVAGATTHLFIDDPDRSIIDRVAVTQDVRTLQERAELYGNLMTTPPVLDAIGKRAGIPASQISGLARVTAQIPHSLLQPRSEQRAGQIADSLSPYRLELQADRGDPVLSIYAEAPSVDEAVRLADSSILGLGDYLRALARQQGLPDQDLPQLRQLGSARGGITNSHSRIVIAGLTFVTAFALTFVLLILLIRRPWRRREAQAPRSVPRQRLTGRAAADWPHTTRLLPWSVALLVAMIWLTPFDKIQLAASAPVNITLDRIILPLVGLIWLISFAAGPDARPRLRASHVHVAIGMFVACAFLSVVTDARYINQTGELMLSLKKLPLLLSYVSVFVIVASSVRRTEARAFLKYSLCLAVICSVEIIYEYHFKQNLFNIWFAKLPHPFEFVAATTGPAVDSLGRSWIEGPSDYGVEAILMLSMVLPVAVLGVLDSKTRRKKAWYGLAAALLLIAMFATQRKSALIAPAAVFLVLAYFRRGQLLKLAPLMLILVVLVPVLSPGAIHGVLSQVTASDSTQVATVSDRTADYDAIRPDLWTHLVLGRGYGSFDPATYRILDSEILSPIVEVGVLGLIAYLSIGVSLILAARKIASRAESRWSSIAQCGVAAGVCLLVTSTLYDLLGFPHGPDAFLYVAGLVVATVAVRDGPGADPPRPRIAASGYLDAPQIRPHAPASPVSRDAVPVG